MADEEGEYVQATDNPRKRKKFGAKRDRAKQLRLQSHVPGPDCGCNRFKCDTVIPAHIQAELLATFNSFETRSEQDSYLTSMIRMKNVNRRRSRKHPNEAAFHEHSFNYVLKFSFSGSVVEKEVCRRKFLSTFGITRRRVSFIQNGLATLGRCPADKRGKHKTRPHALSVGETDSVHKHIKSLRGRQSHYCLGKTRRTYLSEELNIRKLHKMFKTQQPESRVSYESYRRIFHNSYNLSFGYPRKDTCSQCDSLTVKLKQLANDVHSATDPAIKESLSAERQSVVTKKTLHLKKANEFYCRKRVAAKKAKNSEVYTAIAMDFQKNLPMPNITTGDVYYKRQLSFHSFDIHILGSNDVWFYTYDESVARKGSDDVSSMLAHFFTHCLDEKVRVLEIFCDSCGGQNKNYTVFRFLHYMVHVEKRFDSITVTFPVRGHSYMECDRDMSIINQKAPCEVPDDWNKVFAEARENPLPYKVFPCTQDIFYKYSEFFHDKYKPKCPFPTRDIRVLEICKPLPVIYYRNSFHGAKSSAVVCIKKTEGKKTKKGKGGSKKKSSKKKVTATVAVSSELKPLYTGRLAVKKAKFDDVNFLGRFCSEKAQKYFADLPVQSVAKTASKSGARHNMSACDSGSDTEIYTDVE
jgi:hypothetical protein